MYAQEKGSHYLRRLLVSAKVLLGANYQKSCHVSVTYISFFCALLSLTEEAKALRSKRSPRIAHERARTSVITEDNNQHYIILSYTVLIYV